MSPEQARGERIIDDRSDQWSLGVILYECSTGRAPVPEGAPLVTVARIVAGNFPRPRELRPALSAAFEAVVLRAMALRADDRFPSVRDLGAALMPFAGARAQVVWAEVFIGAAPDRRATWSVEGDLGLGTRLSVPEREGPDDTLLDEGAEREGTTVPMRATRRRGWRWLVIAAVVVGVLFVVDWIVWGE